MVTLLTVTSAAFAEDQKPWTLSKSSGEVWTVTPGAQLASLSQQTDLHPGDTIRTGRNGRVMLVRGEESILIAPNSAITIPAAASDGLSTTIVQQAGSILLEVEKRNVRHFEVETPYLAAVVKGTQFRVSVSATGTSVNVLRGQVQVADFKSGQIAQVMPGQAATSYAQGKIGLALSGSGTFNPIEQGKPRTPSIERLMVPKNGLTAPRNAANGMQVHPVGEIKAATNALPATVAAPTAAAAATPGPATSLPGSAKTAVAVAVTSTPAAAALPSIATPKPAKLAAPARAAGLRIGSPIGDVRLNFSKVTNGLARGAGPTPSGRSVASRDTIWTARDGKVASTPQGDAGDARSTSAMVASTVAAAAGTVSLPAAADTGTAAASSATAATTTSTTATTTTAATTPAATTPTTTGATSPGNSSNSNSNSNSGNSGANGNGHGNNGNGYAFGRILGFRNNGHN